MLKLGFIGVGGYGRPQLEGFLPFQSAGRIRIQALADPSPDALAVVAAKFPEAELFLDYREMLDSAELDAVVVCAPIPAHREIALHATRRDLFVLLEKPPVPLFSELRELIAADRQRRVMVAFQHIYKPLVQRMKRVVWSGEIGRPLAISAFGLWPRTTEYYERSSWAGELFREGRATLDGPCTNAMAHFLNSLFFIAGEEPAQFARPECMEGEVYRVRPIASYDVGALRGVLDNGMKFSASFSHASEEKWPVRIRVQGTEGEVELLDNATKFKDARGRIFEGSDGRQELRRAFLDFAEGQAGENLTSLQAMESYVLATNMMFQSSGGIHSVGPDFVEVHEPETPEAVFFVPGLKDLFSASCERMNSFAKMGAAWAQPPQMMFHHEFNEREMLDLFRETLTTSSVSV